MRAKQGVSQKNLVAVIFCNYNLIPIFQLGRKSFRQEFLRRVLCEFQVSYLSNFKPMRYAQTEIETILAK